MAIILNRTTTFATNGTVTAAGLHNLIDDTAIYSGLITTQTNLASVGTGDKLLIAQAAGGDTSSPFSTTVLNLFDDALTGGTYTNANISENLTYGTATGNRTVSTSATITTGTIPNLTSSTANITLGTIPTLTAGTTTSTAQIATSGTIATLNSTTGTIANLSTTLAGDLTISQGTATLSTTGATAATYGTTSAIPVLTVDAKGRTTSATSVTNPVGFRNRIVNGDIGIWQRGTSFTAATYSHSADRWSFGNFVNTTVSQSTSVPTGFKYSLKVQRPAAATSVVPVLAMQTIESVNCLDMAGQSVTLSFYAKAGANYSSASNSLSVQLQTGTVADQGGSSYDTWTGAAQPLSTTVTLTTSFQRFTVTATVASNVLEMAPVFFFTPVGTAGADDSFHITGVQLEVGSTATDFERRPIGAELALCQRYYLKLQPAINNRYGIGRNISTTLSSLTVPFPVSMRVRPTGLEQSGTASHYGIAFLNTAGTCTAVPTFAYSTELVSQVQLTNAAVLTAGQANEAYNVNASGYLAWSAEL